MTAMDDSSSPGRGSRRVSSKILQGTEWLSSIFSKPTKPSTTMTTAKRSSQLVEERMRWLEKQDEFRQSNPSIDISSDLVSERMKLLEQSLTPKEERKENSVVEVSSALVAERMRLLEERKLQGQEKRQSRSVEVCPDLVSERMRWLEDRQAQGQDDQTSLRPYEATSDLVAERLRLLSEQHEKSNNRLSGKEKVQPGKMDTSRRAPSFTTNGRQSQPPSKPEDLTAFGSLAEKKAFFLADKRPSVTPRTSVRIWGEHYMHYVDDMESNLAVELEQEGLIPNFLANWIFGSPHQVDDNSGKDDETPSTSSSPNLMELLSLDYKPVDNRDDSTQSTGESQSLQQTDQGTSSNDSKEMKVGDSFDDTESNTSRALGCDTTENTTENADEKKEEDVLPSVESNQEERNQEELEPSVTAIQSSENNAVAVVNNDPALLLENLDGLVEPFPKTKLDDCCLACQIL